MENICKEKRAGDRDYHFSRILESLDSRKPGISIRGLKGSSPSYLLHWLIKRSDKNFLVVMPDLKKAEEFRDDLNFFLGTEKKSREIFLFPPWEIPPFEPLSPHPEIIRKRLTALHKLLEHQNPFIVIASIEALMQRVMPRNDLTNSTICLKAGEEVEVENLMKKMVEGGYARVNLVMDKGEFSVRGNIFDVFSPLEENPTRIEFMGDNIESMRQFDLLTQRSFSDLSQVIIMPANEIILNRRTIGNAADKVKEWAAETGISPKKRDEFLEKINQSIYFPGIEFFLPSFYPEPETLFHYLPANTATFFHNRQEIEKKIEKMAIEKKDRYHLSLEQGKFFPPFSALYLLREEFDSWINNFFGLWLQELSVYCPDTEGAGFSTSSNEDIRRELLNFRSSKGILLPLAKKITKWQEEGNRIVCVSHTIDQAKRLRELFAGYDLRAEIISGSHRRQKMKSDGRFPVLIMVGDLSRGFRFPLIGLIVVAEEEIFGERKKRRRDSKFKGQTSSSLFGDFKDDDYVVHVDHGVGVYLGLKRIDVRGDENDYLLLEYLDGDRLYVPVDKMNLVQKYTGLDGSIPRIDRLGGNSWQKKKQKTQESVTKMALELLKIYASRETLKGFAFSPENSYFRELEASFEYEETPDQLAAIKDVMGDMESSKPMDRLICGDVGYGKTEVALRASFKAVMDGKQVAILVPTTVLAQQHFQNFTRRFRQYPVNTEMLSRFYTLGKQKEILKKVAEGKIDIIVGTHRLLQKDVNFKDLGLLIVDEEQRFGVSHKEKLKKLKKLVDILVLTATPIPRTLYMSLMGMRDLSIINTPPEDRLAIITYIIKFDEEVIKEAILRELRRRGQIFFVHNRVESIHTMAGYLKKIVPGIRLGIAHGQMSEKLLEKAMIAFLNKEIDLLLCTTIIESGLDFPSANTIVINRADRMGLAQIYQLRGRVGRSKERAYAYLLIPDDKTLTKDAENRLQAISEFSELGSGFQLATRDLEIRGAGNLLGASQSGQIAAVGFDLYSQLMEKAIAELKGQKVAPRIEPEIKLNIPAKIPDGYISDINQRLLLYRRIASLASNHAILDIREELVDRYGEIPPPLENLLEVVRGKNLLKKFLITSLEYNNREIALAFHPEASTSLEKIFALIESDASRFSFSPDLKLRIAFGKKKSWRDVLSEVRNILH